MPILNVLKNAHSQDAQNILRMLKTPILKMLKTPILQMLKTLIHKMLQNAHSQNVPERLFLRYLG